MGIRHRLSFESCSTEDQGGVLVLGQFPAQIMSSPIQTFKGPCIRRCHPSFAVSARWPTPVPVTTSALVEDEIRASYVAYSVLRRHPTTPRGIPTWSSTKFQLPPGVNILYLLVRKSTFELDFLLSVQDRTERPIIWYRVILLSRSWVLPKALIPWTEDRGIRRRFMFWNIPHSTFLTSRGRRAHRA
ncbi:uncharacterized protein [Physcomitrium patens]|uniref:Uncharacterized protein n=1 Tax=Physcomitrium patens TaxID=3218 RepID=A0A2K1K5R7_PHYPA|nr:hypothetical protein PHYPA_011019 [Physcomitrium patens]